MDLFRALRTALGDLPIVAEDLGEIFDSVRVLLAESGFPGMKVLQFSLNGTDSLDLPHNYPAHCLAYPGTHDNNTLRGWLENETTPRPAQTGQGIFCPDRAGGRDHRPAARCAGKPGGAGYCDDGRLAGKKAAKPA